MKRTHTPNHTSMLHALRFTFRDSSGLTLIEMIVTVAIFALISTVVLVRNSSFDNETLLQGLAYDIALSIRQAQQFGINVRVSGEQFQQPYGVYFETGSNTYVMFRDGNENNTYDGEEELLETFTIGRGATIGDLCDLGAKDSCNLKSLNIIFHRPDPDAIMNGGTISQATIELVPARQGGSRLITVESTGQISISRPPDEKEGGIVDDGILSI